MNASASRKLWGHFPSSQNPLLKPVLPQTVSHSGAGISNINAGIIANNNGKFVLHEGQGFEHGEHENFKQAVDFLKARKDMPNVRDQVHAVWYVYRSSITCTRVIKALRRLCFQTPLSEGHRLFEADVEEILRMKYNGDLGPGRFSVFSGRRRLTVWFSSRDQRFYQIW